MADEFLYTDVLAVVGFEVVERFMPTATPDLRNTPKCLQTHLADWRNLL